MISLKHHSSLLGQMYLPVFSHMKLEKKTMEDKIFNVTMEELNSLVAKQLH